MNEPFCSTQRRRRHSRRTLVGGLAVLTALIVAGCVANLDRTDPGLRVELRAVSFLKREVPAWSRENHCFSCHNNGDAARALYAASRKGHLIPSRVLADTTAWVAQPAGWDENKGDPGFSDRRLANVQFAASLLAAVEAGQVRDRQALRDAARKVVADQAADGSWPIDAGNAVGSPTTYGTTLATFMAVRTLKAASDPGTEDAIQKADQWLRQVKPDNVLAAATVLLASQRNREECLVLIRRAQTADGGWGPYPDSPPETFDTALVLLALQKMREEVGVNGMVQRGRAFLLSQQEGDGGWPATTRPSGASSYAQRISTTGWATLALLATRDWTVSQK